MDPVAQLNGMIERVRRLGAAGPEFAKVAATELRAQIEENIAAGRGPDGVAWEPTEEGKKPLQGAAAALEVTSVGTVVIARISGYHANHHKGKTRGNIARPILPSRKLNGPAVKAIAEVLRKHYGEIMGDG